MKKSKTLWTHEQLQRNTFKATTEYERNKNWERWFLLTSDQHWDNSHSNHALQLKHLEEAKERQASVISAGDYFCLMNGKYDKRSSQSMLRPEHRGSNYLNLVIDTATGFLAPYAENYFFIATGNHEESISDRHGFNFIDGFCTAVYQATHSKIYNGGYSGYLLFSFKKKNANGSRFCYCLRYEHGAGGGAPVTGGVIDSYRKAVSYPDADIYLSGHTHDSFVREIQRERVDKNSGTRRMEVHTQLKIPSYKDEYGDGFSGWATATKGIPPKPIGAYWLRFYFDWTHERVLYEVIRAQ